MGKIIKYIPDSPMPFGGFPAVIGLPGFVGTLEGGRIDAILKELCSKGTAGYGVLYDGIDEERITDRNRKVVCNFNLNSYTEDIRQAFERISEDERINLGGVGVLAASISGCVFAHALVNKKLNGITPRRYASVSPLVGYSSYRTERERRGLEMAIKEGIMKEIPITSPFDKERGIERVIPASCADELKALDSLSELRAGYSSRRMNVMTIIGGKDKTSNPKEMMDYHNALHGDGRNLLVFSDEDHNIPLNLMREKVIEFFAPL